INKTYKFSGWIKTQNIVGSGAIAVIDWKSSTNTHLGTSYVTSAKTGTNAWTRFEGIVTPKPNSTIATVVLRLSNSSGKVWFDDIQRISGFP
ncbi:MAG: hypothetical protein M0036_00025, partial [Desulfobacteraceae bacterium]|nr:hypothetical protein [Desulfobacteraceae bacterium]